MYDMLLTSSYSYNVVILYMYKKDVADMFVPYRHEQ